MCVCVCLKDTIQVGRERKIENSGVSDGERERVSKRKRAREGSPNTTPLILY